MDGSLDMDPISGFSLTEAKSIVEAATNTVHPVEITTAHRTSGTGCDVANFTFNGTHSVGGSNRNIHYYDQIWIFSIGTSSNPAFGALDTATELPEIETFMNNKGGVFCTGDHGDLGASICENIPRVKSMRQWRQANGAPSMSGLTRIDTNVPNPNFSPDFDLQSDTLAQRIYPMWQGEFDSDYLPHPVLEMPNGKSVTHLPDHAHEGRCVVPNALDPAEYPTDGGGIQVSPEVIAYGVSGGAGFSASKVSITPPELFGVIGAYDGHQASIGRVVVDSTWHHWLNINLNGTGAGTIDGVNQNGLYDALNNPTPEYLEIQRYFQNIAAWLQPNRFLICFIIYWPCLRWKWPLIEELEPLDDPRLFDFIDLGKSVEKLILPYRGVSGVLEMVDSVLHLAKAPQSLRNTYNMLYRGKETTLLPGIFRKEMVVQAILGGVMNELATKLPSSEQETMTYIKELVEKYSGQDESPLHDIIAQGARRALALIKEELAVYEKDLNAFSKSLK
jgi:hypothetical protein